ncbi:hypothetical protein HHX48_03215 [Salinimonas sp. HHU 13199]|uniref:STAS/SEC14 domain-containing protein n=1 Tax=Salinimonas profundi TaxID=2729140 RepID=A0ABR8LEP2_9ALTE|nr:hypothetical protein [Salinimonas profundi]MBD3584744.1 hypothetical protein [Salinimonas profundi]
MFEAHGSFKTTIHNNVLLVDIIGPWNLETALNYERHISQITASLVGAPWAMITDLYDWELYTPDCYPIIHQLVNKCIENGLHREAVISPQKSIKRRPFEVDRAHYPQFSRAFFIDYPPARQWLAEQAFFAPDR